MKIGQKVLIETGSGPEIQGEVLGNSEDSNMVLVRLSPEDSGFIQPDGRRRQPKIFVSCLAVHPNNITVLE